MASEDIVEEQQPAVSDGGGQPTWMDDLGAYLNKKPNASDEELFKQFPQLNKDSKRLDAAFSYVHAKSQGMTDEDAKKLYPDLITPMGYAGAPQPEKPVEQEETSSIPKFDSAAYGKKIMKANASESTSGGSTKILQDVKGQEATAEQERKTQAKYKPVVDKALADIESNKSAFIDNQRPALDFHPDAPDSYYDVPKMPAIDSYLKQTIEDPTTRYYVRNQIMNQLQHQKESYSVGKIAERKVEEIPAVAQAKKEVTDNPDNLGKPADQAAVLRRAKEIDPDLDTKVMSAEKDAVQAHENVKNEFTRALLNNSTSLEYDENGNIRKVNTLDPDTPFHDQITGAGKALQGVFKFSGQAGQMASGILKFFGAKESGYNLQKTADDYLSKNAFPGGDQTPSEFLAGEALPMVLQGQAMGQFAKGLGAPMFKALSGAAARGLIGKAAEGALGGVALAPINSALISHDYYTSLIRAGETPEVAHAKAERVFDKNLVTDMAISPLQFGIMNAPVNNVIAKATLQYGVSPLIAGVHFMTQDYFQQKENNPALTVWKYATSPDGIKTGITGAVTGLLQHYVIGKMNDWQNDKTVKDAFSFGRKDQSPETAALPNNNVLASTVLNAFEMKDSPKRAGELSGLVDELHQKGVYNDQEAAKINGIIDDVAAVKGLVPKMGTSPQRMAVFNELLNKRAYESQLPDAGNIAVSDMLEGKMKESDQRIQAIMNGEEPLYFINGNETSKEQLMEWVKNNPDLVASKALNIDIINDDETKQAIQDAKNQPFEQEPAKSGGKEAAPGEEVPAEAQTNVTEVRHAITPEDDLGITGGHTDVRLNEEGKAQADKLGDEMTGKDVRKVLSSGLPREAETAQIVADKLGVPHGTIPEIKSWDIGELDKMKDTDFKKAEEYLVQHPDEKEFEGKKVSESFNEYKDRVIAAREKIEKDAGDHTLVVNGGGNIKVWDAYQKNGRKWNTQAANDYLNAPDLEPAALRQPVQEAAKPVELPGRTPEFSKFYNDFKDEIGAVKDSSFDFRVDMPMDQKTREGAVKDIEKGKETKRAKLFLDELQKQHDGGVIEYTRGRGNHVEKFGIPIEEWGKLQEAAEPEVLKDIESGAMPADELAKWLQEEADKIIENEPERTEGETGHASGESEAGTSEGKLLHPVQEVDEAKARDRSGATEDESQSAGDGSARSVRETGEAKGDQHGKNQATKNLEESEAINELAKRHGKTPLPKLKEDDIPADLEKKGIPVNNMVEADAHWGNGLGMFAFHEQDEEPHEVHSLEELRNFTPDQLLAYPDKRNASSGAEQHTPFKSTASALEEIGKYYPKDPLISRVVDFLKPILDANPSIRIDNDYDFTGKPGIGYSEDDGRIGLRYSALKDKDALYRTALHEMVHAATRAEIEKSAAFKDDIRDVLTEVRKALKLPDNDAIIPLLVQKGIIEADKYGASNEHELIAEIFTNQKFNDYLKGIKYNGDSLLKKFYLAIAKHFSSAYKILVSAKSEISANNMADYLMKLTESVVKSTGTDAAGSLPNMAGERSSALNRAALDEAKSRTERGDDPEDIFKDTNWYRDPHDNKWKYELPNESKVLPKTSEETLPLDKVIEYPSLFEAYPSIRDVPIHFSDMPKDVAGEFDGSSITLNKQNDDFLNHRTLVHEIQHIIQTKEGFAEGTDPEIGGMYLLERIHKQALRELSNLMVNMGTKGAKYNGPEVTERINRLKKTVDVMNQQTELAARRAYEATAGEVEAENTETRLDPDSRKKGSPLQTRKRYSNLITTSIVDGKISFPDRPDEHNADVAYYKDSKSRLMKSVAKGPSTGKTGSLAMIDKGQAINEQFVREKINDYKEATLIKALSVSGNMTEDEAKDLVKQIRDEQNLSPEEIIRQAMELGKKANAGAGKQIMAPLAADNMKPSLMKTLRRWYFDGKDEVSDVKSIIRKNKGAEEFEIDKIYHATKKLVNDWNKVPKVKQMAFMLGMEKPEFLAGQSQAIKDMAATYKGRLDKTFETIGKVLPDLNYVEDYFPHFWEKPEQARNFFASTLAKAPLEGGKSFAKKRFFETIVAGLKEGYKLSTTNPEEMVRLAEANAWKFTTAHDIFNDMKKAGYLKYAMGKDKPEGWETVQDPMFVKMAATVDKNGNPDLVRGAFYMPPDVAKLVNDYLSPGLKGPVKSFIQQYNNIKNLFQLGVGFFHFGTTSLDSMVTGMTNGIQKLSAGNVKGLLDLATLGNLPATLYRGFKAKSDWNAGKLTADTQSLMDANAKVGRQKMYSLDAKYNMMKAFGQLRADKDFSQLPKALWNGMLFLPEAINKPLMEHWVPALKVGGYLRSLDSEISSRKNMTPAELQTAKQKIWDSMDDRLGQVVYDNIFMKKAAKDLAFLTIRSAGWTGGTIRAVSGGLAELPRSGQRLFRGQGLSQRTAYLAALPLTVGILGGFIHYLMTGTPPDELKDYFFPKDGTKSPDGTDHRLVLPSYMKDILAYGKSPVTTLLHKTAPFLNDVVELYNNKDFYGERVYNKDDPFYKKGIDILKHEGETMEPFSFRTDPNAADQTHSQWWMQKFGITNAPREREKSDIQNKISQAYSAQIGKDQEGKTHEEMEQIIARKHLRNFIFAGGDYKDASQELKDKAGLKPQALAKFIHDSKMDPYERYFKQLRPETKVSLYRQMSDEDKGKYGHWIPIKDRSAANAPKPDDE